MIEPGNLMVIRSYAVFAPLEYLIRAYPSRDTRTQKRVKAPLTIFVALIYDENIVIQKHLRVDRHIL